MAPKATGSDLVTTVTSVEADRILVRGYPIDELMGRVTFPDAVYLVLTGELPPTSIARLISALLTGFIDEGVSPSALAARQAARSGASLSGAVAASLLTFDHQHAGGLARCRELLDRCLDRAGSSMLLASAATDLVEEMVQAEQIPPPGFGAHIHASDPRVARLLQMAHELEVDALYSRCLRAIAGALAQHPALADEALAINVDGALAAVCGDLGLTPPVAEALLVVARLPGLLAHSIEELGREASTGSAYRYDGPSERRLRDRR